MLTAVRHPAVRSRSAHGRSAEQDRRDRHLIEAARACGDPGARARAATELLPLAQRLARRYVRGGEPLEDLEQVASIGLRRILASLSGTAVAGLNPDLRIARTT